MDEGDVTEQIAAITAIGQGDDMLEQRVSLLANAMASREQTIESIAMLSIQRLGDRVKPDVRKLFDSSNPGERHKGCSVVRAMGENGDEYAEDLLKMLKEGGTRDRHAALYAMQQLSADVLLPGLKDVTMALDEEDFNTQCQACFVLKKMGPGAAAATEQLVLLLEEGNPSTRSRAAEALASIGPVEGFDVPGLIVARLKADAFLEKKRALDAIATLGPAADTKENREAIQVLIDTTKHNCVAEASLAYYKVTGEKDPAKKRIMQLLKSPTSRVAAIECLGAMGEDAADTVPQLLGYLKNEELVVSESAILALKNIGPPAAEALPRLEKMLSHDDFLITVAAQEAIDSISGKNAGK